MNEEIKAASVDSPEFRELIRIIFGDVVEEGHQALIAHINAWADERCNQLAASCAMLPVTDSRLLAFVDRLIDGAFDGASFDGGDIQELATEHGLLQVQDMPEPCGEGCRCAQDVPFFPAQCFRKTYLALATPVAGWVSVEDERKPAEHELVAVIGPAYGSFDKGRYVSSATYYNGEFFTEDGDMMHPPSHWCALPPAPVVTPTQQEPQ